MQAMQLGEIDGLAVEAEAPAERRQQEAHRHDPPAVVMRRALVDGDLTRGVHADLC